MHFQKLHFLLLSTNVTESTLMSGVLGLVLEMAY